MKPAAEARARQLLRTQAANTVARIIRAEGHRARDRDLRALRAEMVEQGLAVPLSVARPKDGWIDDSIAEGQFDDMVTAGSAQLLAAIAEYHPEMMRA